MQNLHDFMHTSQKGSNSRDLETPNAVAEVFLGGKPEPLRACACGRAYSTSWCLAGSLGGCRAQVAIRKGKG